MLYSSAKKWKEEQYKSAGATNFREIKNSLQTASIEFQSATVPIPGIKSIFKLRNSAAGGT